MAASLGKTFYASNRKQWRSWLLKNHSKEKEIWLIYYRSATGKPRIPYDDAVEEALCYGWIDSIVRRIDNERFAQRFSPRKSTSSLSQPNKERVRKLIRQGKMTKAGLTAIAHVFDPVRDKKDKFIIPPDILKPLKANRKTWLNFKHFPESYQRIRVAFVESRKRHGKKAYKKSLDNLIKMTTKNRKIGYVKV